jgi:hypothetical protein
VSRKVENNNVRAVDLESCSIAEMIFFKESKKGAGRE